ncbi:hypothetical protein JRQ81_018991 [Phrynocephalus forsythii]|uniref:Uncharacterized protein n=1 Tax=Phrynocephalus forsythii TaxID=171643 RepID=A0A9Q0XQK8_9SAUR|nr:hypothetical protein JRQ81_018991 [Phrynocephalus forsythii]
MALKNATESRKMEKEKILLDVKEITLQHEEGMRVIDITKEYSRNQSTSSNILKNKEITR